MLPDLVASLSKWGVSIGEGLPGEEQNAPPEVTEHDQENCLRHTTGSPRRNEKRRPAAQIAGLGRHDAEILKYIEKRCQVSEKWARLNWGLSCWLVWMLSIHVGMSKIHNSWRESQRVTCCYGFMRIVVLPVVEIAACWCLKFDRKSFRMFPPNEST